MNDSFFIVPPLGAPLPIVVSCPHSGIEIPSDIAKSMRREMAEGVPDTDWFVHDLYSFAPAMGITLLHARYNRFVIDLNRDPENKPLYTDGRHMTGLVPVTSFDARPIYVDGASPDPIEVERRLATFYRPYHAKAHELVAGLKTKFKHVLFFEAHSIKRHVPTIRQEPFPDLMLGDQRGKTADEAVSTAALLRLQSGNHFSVAHNDPFMGGYLTRAFGRPQEGVHALQLEMSQDVYMNEHDGSHDKAKQDAMSAHLQTLLAGLARTLGSLP